MQEITPAIANRIAAFIADGKSFFTIAKFHGMPESRTMRSWTLHDHGFREKIARARMMRQPRHTAPKGDHPATWGVDDDQMDFSSQHGAIIPVEVRVHGSKTKQQGLRRAPDARMFESFTPVQEKAFYRIARGAQVTASGLGCKAFDYSKARGGTGHGADQERDAEAFSDYKHWHVDCRRQDLNPDMAKDVIVGGMNITESAQYRAADRKTVKQNLTGCLEAYARRKGWA